MLRYSKLSNINRRVIFNQVIKSTKCTRFSSSSALTIPVPWGQISAKKFPRLKPLSKNYQPPNSPTLGVDKSLPFLCFHGWLDNANSFDKLIPLIQEKHPDLEFLCFDWPGHGLSSHRPNGTYNNVTVYMSDIHRILNFLKLKKFNSMGHSLGGNALVQYTSVFPNQNKNMIRLESDGFVVYNSSHLKDSIVRSVTNQIKYDNLLMNGIKSDKKYTYQQAKERLAKGSDWHGEFIPASVEGDSLDILLERGLKKLENEFDKSGNQLYMFSRDIKVILPTIPAYTIEDANELITSGYSEATHNELLIQANDNIWVNLMVSRNPKLWDLWGHNLPHALYSKNENFQMVCVEGNHHVHLNDPKVMIEKICNWIDNPRDTKGAIDDVQLRELRVPEKFRPK